MTFSIDAGSNIILDNNGKIGACYSRSTKQTSGKIVSNSTINLSEDISMACWALVSDCVGDTANGLISNHSHANNTGVGITVKQVSTSDYRISCNTGTGSNRTYSTYYGTTNIKGAWHHLALTYSKSAKQLILYVDGNAEYTLNNYVNSSIADYIIIFDWSTTYSGISYRPAAKLNDVRIYDHCLSPKEVKEIAKGLVLHYPLNDAYVEGTANKFTYPTPGSSCANSYGWDKTLHKDAISVSGWSSGYNSGVGNPTTVYHAHWIMMDDLPTMRFPYITNSSGQTPSWLGISGGGLNVADFLVGTKYTVSFDAKADENNSSISCGMYYKRNASENWNFYDGNIGIALTTNWKRYSITYTSQGANAISSFYFYGTCGGSKGNRYVRNVQLEIKDHATPYTPNTRNETIVHDCSGYQNNGTIRGSLSYIGDSPRYKISTHFISSIPSRINLPSDMSCLSGNNEQTLSCWVKSSGLGSGMTQSGLIALGYGNSLFLNASDYCYRIDNGSSLGTVGANQNPHDGNWHLVTATYKSGVASIYIDGVLKNSVSRIFSNRYINNGGNCIGTEVNNSPIYNLNGDISDIRMYTTALSADDIRELYNTSCIVNS